MENPVFYDNSARGLMYDIRRFIEEAKRQNLSADEILEAISKAKVEQCADHF